MSKGGTRRDSLFNYILQCPIYHREVVSRSVVNHLSASGGMYSSLRVVAVLRSDLGGVFALLALICFTAARNNSRVDLVDAYSWGSCQMITAVHGIW
jgi:hypothetical protein